MTVILGPALPNLRGLHHPDFHDVMRYRIMDILLVASPYDSFLLEESGELSERVRGEFRNLDLHYGPGLTPAPTGADALASAAETNRFGLVISTLHLGDMSGADLARRLRAAGVTTPIVLLAYDSRELQAVLEREDLSSVERVFLWQGDARILLAIVKSVEDRRNVAHDTRTVGVQVMLLVEDNVRYYSAFLPAIYAELLHHSQRLIAEGANLAEKILRMRARPKILLCGTFEEAWEVFELYHQDLLGVVSDVEFPRGGHWSAVAGLDLARLVKERWPDVPVLLQSSRPENAFLAAEVGADFLVKGSPVLLNDLRRFMLDNLGFGDFVFRLPDGSEVARAHDLRTLEEHLGTVPAESIAFHAERNHFSKWLKARTEFALAHELRPRKVADYPSVGHMRQHLVDTIASYRRDRSRTMVADFDRSTFDGSEGFCRIGAGSLGGKARGLAFLRRLLAEARIDREFQGIDIAVPPLVALGTDVFDRFLDENELRAFALGCDDESLIASRFLAAELPEETTLDLAAYLERIPDPLAVRSSSLLEDSQYQPFSGVYETLMLANNQPSRESRLAHLVDAVKRVYASTFSRHAKGYIRATPYRLEEEKMAVIIQKVVGASRHDRFYPDLAGVARSHNCYPHPPLAAEDGIAAVVLGLGRGVVEGGSCVRFCPRLPQYIVGFSSVEDILRNSQRSFWAIDLSRGAAHPAHDLKTGETCFDLEAAETDGTLAPLASTYSPDDHTVREGTAHPGLRLLTFAPLLNRGLVPLPEILERVMQLGAWGMGSPVEIEFALNLAQGPARRQEFAVLQLRPLAFSGETEELDLGNVEGHSVLCRSSSVLGNGRIDNLRDVVVVDRQRFERAHSRQAAADLAQINATLTGSGTPYLLIGVGRWGSSDPWLGIPVAWEQISGARVIVEAGFKDLRVTPSQGTHFFQNLTSFNVGYFTVNPDAGEGFLDWGWLAACEAFAETDNARHLRFGRPLVVKMSGKTNQGLILKPSE